MEKKKYSLITNIIGIICLAVGVGVLAYTTRFIFSQDIWFDELFTVELANMPIDRLIALASQDVHPPLYYICVRGVYLLCHVLFKNMTIISAAKLTSILPYYFIIIYAVTYVRKRFGFISAGLMVLFIELMPNMSAYMVEARMYSVSMFVLIGMFIHGLESVNGVPYEFCIRNEISYEDACSHTWCFWNKNKKRIPGVFKMYLNLIIACLYAICAMYFHYYAFIGAAAIALIMIVYVVLNNYKGKRIVDSWKEKEDETIHQIRIRPDIASLIAVVVICLMAYVPWEGAMLSQTGNVSKSYWIQPLTFKSLFGCLKFIFKPEFESTAISYLIAIILIAVVTYFFVRFFVSKIKKIDIDEEENEKGKDDIIFVMSTIATLVILVAVGFILSFLIRPIFVYRYMLPVLGIFWMGVAVVFGAFIRDNEDKLVPFISGAFLLVLVIVFVRDYRLFKWEELKKQNGIIDSQNAFNMIDASYSDDILVCNFNQVQAVLWHYLDNDSVLYGETDELLVGEVCGRAPMVMTESIDEVKSIATNSSGKNEFIFIGSGNAREDIISEWEADGLTVNLIADSCLLERYYFNVYNVSWR